MESIIGLLIVIILIVIGIVYMKKNDNTALTYEELIETPIDENNQIPLQDETYRNQNKYNNIAQNQRTDAIMDVLHKIHFWIVIIGIYFLFKIVVGLISFFTMLSMGHEIIDIFEGIF